MFKKSTLKTVLPAALLCASANAFAQGGVTLGNGQTKTWEEVVSYLNNNGADLDALQQAVTTAQNEASRIDPKSETVPVQWLSDLQAEATTFQKAYYGWYDNVGAAAPATPKIWYKANTNQGGNVSLYVAFSKVDDYTESTIADFYKDVLSPEATLNDKQVKVTSVSVYLGSDLKDGDIEYTGANPRAVTGYTQAQQEDIPNLIVNFLNNTLSTETGCKKTANTAAYQAALDKVNTAEANYNTALTNQKAYNNLTLTADVNASVGITSAYGGTIIGNGWTINAPENGSVFTKFTGELSMVSVNGSFATSSNGADFDNVALWNNNSGTYYNGNGVATENMSLGELAYAGRNFYGVANGKLAKGTDANRVYSVDVYSTIPSEEPVQHYVTYAAGSFTDVDANSALTVATNAFVKSATGDLLNAEGVTNVFYNNQASKVVITDGSAFYCPETINAASVEYKHSFNGKGTICLPFAISSEILRGAKIATFDEQKGEELYFTVVTEAVDAYTPVLVNAETAVEFTGVASATQIAKTDAKQIVEGTSKGSGMSYGLLKKANASEILSDYSKDKVYGFRNGEFQLAGENATFSPFTMAIALDEVAPTSAPLRIVVRGENEESGVEDVANDAEGLEVVGGQGELIINASADCGNVAVYTLDGRVAANVDVVAGTTSVNLAKGVYIVMGKKVLVK